MRKQYLQRSGTVLENHQNKTRDSYLPTKCLHEIKKSFIFEVEFLDDTEFLLQRKYLFYPFKLICASVISITPVPSYKIFVFCFLDKPSHSLLVIRVKIWKAVSETIENTWVDSIIEFWTFVKRIFFNCRRGWNVNVGKVEAGLKCTLLYCCN